MFPTLFGVTSIGIANFASRSVVIIAPLVAEIAFPVPMYIFAVSNMIAAVATMFIREQPKEEKSKELKAE